MQRCADPALPSNQHSEFTVTLTKVRKRKGVCACHLQLVLPTNSQAGAVWRETRHVPRCCTRHFDCSHFLPAACRTMKLEDLKELLAIGVPGNCTVLGEKGTRRLVLIQQIHLDIISYHTTHQSRPYIIAAAARCCLSACHNLCCMHDIKW